MKLCHRRDVGIDSETGREVVTALLGPVPASQGAEWLPSAWRDWLRAIPAPEPRRSR